MISYSCIEAFKSMAQIQSELIPQGVAYFLVEEDKITWKCNSSNFDIPSLQVGTIPNKNGGAIRAINEKRIIKDKIPKNIYGTRINITSIPVTDESGHIIGAISIAMPRFHPVIEGFENYAPLFAEMFHEGVFIYATDLESIIKKQGSTKFDLPNVSIGYKLKDDDIAYKAIKSKKVHQEHGEPSKHGVETYIIAYPLFDQDDNHTIIGTLGMVVPKSIESQLFSMSHNIKSGLSGITGAITELAEAAAKIHENEMILNESINEVFHLTNEINNISYI